MHGVVHSADDFGAQQQLIQLIHQILFQLIAQALTQQQPGGLLFTQRFFGVGQDAEAP